MQSIVFNIHVQRKYHLPSDKNIENTIEVTFLLHICIVVHDYTEW